MAGIYSGIHLKLKSSKIPWDQKLKLAHFAWISHQCFIPNKEQFLLDWVSQALVGFHTKKLNLEENVEQKLWIFLDDILHSKRLQSLMEESKSLNLRFTVAQVMNDIFANTPTQSTPSLSIGTVLSCCQGILSTPCLGMVYKAKCELMVELLNKLSLLACHCLTSEHAIKHQVLNVLNISLKQYTLLQRQQSNSNRLFTQVLTQLLEPFLLLRNALNVHVFERDGNIGISQLIKDIGSYIEVVLHTGLFQAELITFYKEQLLLQQEKSEKKKGQLKDSLTPVCSMLAKLEKIEFCDKETQLSFLADSIPLLYKLFLNSYCRSGNETLCFQMFVTLFRCLCAPFTVKQDYKMVSFPVWSVGITALETLLNLVQSHNLYNIAEDNIRGKAVQYKFYRSLTEILVCNPCTSSPPWFRCLKTLNLLNHLIVEPDLADILHACIKADISDIRIRKAQETFVVSLLKTYTKLRQFPKLFQKILTVICEPAMEKIKYSIFLSGWTEKLAECFVQLPPNQMLDLWAMFLENWPLPQPGDKPSPGLKLECLASLLQCLMMDMKSLDNNTPVPVIHRFQRLMKQIGEELILPSLAILKEDNAEADDVSGCQKLCDVVLMLLNTWIEVNTVTALNCDTYVSQMCELVLPLEKASECWDFSIFFEDEECWRKIANLCRQSGVFSMFYLGLLSVQKIKLLLLHAHVPTEYERLTLQSSASFFVNSSINLMTHKDQKSHGANINAFNVNCLPAAQWRFIVSHITILLPYISHEDIKNIAEFLLETLLPASDQSKQADTDVTISFKEISRSLLQSDSFSEMPIFQSIFITSIIKKCSALVKKQSVLHEILDLLSLKDAKNVNPGVAGGCDDSVLVTSMKTALQLASLVSKEKYFAIPIDKDRNLITSLIELILVLKPDSLQPLDLCRCFFLLLSLANSSKSLHATGECYRGLTYIISCTHANYLFKIAFANEVVQVFMTCIQSANWTLSEDNEQHWPKFLDIVDSFFDTFLSLVIKRKQSVLINLEKCSTFVLDSVSTKKSRFWSTCVGQLHIVILKSLCNHLTLTVQEHNADKERSESFSCLLKRATIKLKTVIQQCLELTDSSPFLPSLLVTSTTALLRAELGAEDSLCNDELYKMFFRQILKELCYAKEHNAFLKHALHYLTICIPVKEVNPEQSGLSISVFTAVGNLLACPWFNKEMLQNVEMELHELLKEVTENCTCEEFHTLLKIIFNKLEVSNLKENDKVLFAGITMIRILLNCSLQQDKSMLFWTTASQIISALVTLSIEACKKRSLLSTLVAPILDTLALFLRRGELFLSNPHHVTLSLSTLLMVSLENVKAEDYYGVFLAIHEVLFSVLQCHSKVMLKAVPTFLNCFHKLVASVMHEGRQKGDKGATCVQNCAKLVERMYTFIAAKTEEFTVFSAFIVSQYIHELQKVTLQPEVKKCLTEGIFHILDLCIDRDIKALNTSLHIGAREVFKELYHDYSTSYKTRSQEEEKYMV